MAARNGNRELQQAIHQLIQAQATLPAAHATLAASEARLNERMAAADDRFLRIERDLDDIKAILLRHEQMLANLPEAIRQKIGYQGQ